MKTNVLAKREAITTRNNKTLDVIKVCFREYPEGFKKTMELMSSKGFKYYNATYDIVDGKKVYKTAGYFGIKYDAKIWNWVVKNFDVTDKNEGFKKSKATKPAVVLNNDVPKETKKNSKPTRAEMLKALDNLTDAQLAKLIAALK